MRSDSMHAIRATHTYAPTLSQPPLVNVHVNVHPLLRIRTDLLAPKGRATSVMMLHDDK